MKFSTSYKFLFVLAFVGTVHAEGACLPGEYQTTPSGNQGPVGCAPMPGRSQPTQTWTNPWGAAAEDKETGTFGISSDAPTKRKASSMAIQDCEARGGKKCRILMTYNNQCLAIVSSTSNYGISSAETEKKATESANRTCQKNSDGKKCWTYYSGCSLPVRN